jgi:lactoylglutathione lyase
MIINHINLTVSDVPAAKTFLETYFGMRGMGEERENKNFTVLFDDAGLVLTLMKGARGSAVEYPSTFHIGFGQPDEAAVNAIYERMKADGFDVKPPERHHAWTFYVNAPGGFMVEIMA